MMREALIIRNKENLRQSATSQPEREQYQASFILVFAAFKICLTVSKPAKHILNPPHHFRTHQYIVKHSEWPTRWKTSM